MKQAVAGFLMEKEIRYLDMAVHPKERPLVAVLGGAKVSDKIQVIEALLERVDALLIGDARDLLPMAPLLSLVELM